MSERDNYTPDEWRTLQFAPFWIFSAVIGAYNRFDPREYQAFVRCLEGAATAEGRLGHEVLASVMADRDRLAEKFGNDRRSIGVGLFEVDAVLGRAPDEEAVRFKDMLVTEIGEGVAKARGRFGVEMSDEDAKRLGLAAQLLYFDRYPVDD